MMEMQVGPQELEDDAVGMNPDFPGRVGEASLHRVGADLWSHLGVHQPPRVLQQPRPERVLGVELRQARLPEMEFGEAVMWKKRPQGAHWASCLAFGATASTWE